MNKYNFSNYIQ
jgi:hypothetical protein